MDTNSKALSEDLFIQHFRFVQDESGNLIKIPSSPGLHGYLVVDSIDHIYHQIRLLASNDEEVQHLHQSLWESIQSQNDSMLFPEISLHGTDDDIPFYVSTLPNGESAKSFLGRGIIVPPAEAARLIARFVGRLRSQSLIPAHQYAISSDSLWIDSRSSGPRIILGDVAVTKSPEAETENCAICLELLKQLGGGAPEASFQMLCASLEVAPQNLASLESALRNYLEGFPPVSNFWTETNKPRRILDSLVTEKDIIEDIAMSADTVPVKVRPHALIDKFKYLVGTAGIVALAWFGVQRFNEARNAGFEILKIPSRPETIETRDVELSAMPRLEAIALPNGETLPLASIPAPLQAVFDQSPDPLPLTFASPIPDPDVELSPFNLDDHLLSIEPLAPSSPIPGTDLKTEDPPGKPYLEIDEMIVYGAVDSIMRNSPGLRAAKIRLEGETIFKNENATETDQRKAFFHFVEAARLGDARADFLAGKCLVMGDGTEKDPQRGVGYLKKAAEQEQAPAMDLLGICFLRGWGVEIDEIEAVRWFQHAVKHDHIPAYFNLGVRYAQGQGVERNPQAAADLFQIGAERGNSQCMLVYAKCLETGFGRKENYQKAVYWFKKSAIAENFEAIQWCINEQVDFKQSYP